MRFSVSLLAAVLAATVAAQPRPDTPKSLSNADLQSSSHAAPIPRVAGPPNGKGPPPGAGNPHPNGPPGNPTTTSMSMPMSTGMSQPPAGIMSMPCPSMCWNQAAVQAMCDPNTSDDCLCGPFFDAVTECTMQQCSVADDLQAVNYLDSGC